MTTPDRPERRDESRGGVRALIDDLLHRSSGSDSDPRSTSGRPAGGATRGAGTGRAPEDPRRGAAPAPAGPEHTTGESPTVAAQARRGPDGPDGSGADDSGSQGPGGPPDAGRQLAAPADPARRYDSPTHSGRPGHGAEPGRQPRAGRPAWTPPQSGMGAAGMGAAGVAGGGQHASTVGSSASVASPPGTAASGHERLVPADRAAGYAARWDSLKGGFVDEPRQAITQADALVGELLEEMARLLDDRRRDLEHGLDTDEASTEDLRLALRRYRSFLDRLLSL